MTPWLYILIWPHHTIELSRITTFLDNYGIKRIILSAAQLSSGKFQKLSIKFALKQSFEMIRMQIVNIFLFYQFTVLVYSLTVSKDDQVDLFKRGALEATNRAIDHTQAKAQRAHDRVTGVGHVLSDHFGASSIKKDVKAAWHPESAGKHQKRGLQAGKVENTVLWQKRGLNDKIDHAQASVTGFHDRVHGVKEVVKDHAKNNGLVQDVTAAWGHGKHHHKRDLIKRESISIDQVLGRSHSGHSRLAKRDFVDSANRAIDQAQDDITDAHNKVHAIKHVLGQHVKNDLFVNDVKVAWDTGDANI